jgi:hypothetical protein
MAKKTEIKTARIIDGHHKPAIKQIIDSKNNTIKLEAKFPLLSRENENSWIVYSPHFKTYGYSNKSEAEATENFKSSLNIFFNVHRKRGTLEKALVEFGWTKVNNSLKKPKFFNTPIRKGVVRTEVNLRSLLVA